MHQAIETLVCSGNSVIADHVLVEEVWWQDCNERFSAFPTFLVGVRCPLEMLEEREKARRDRTLGQVCVQLAVVHGLGIYDVKVETAQYTTEECALQIIKQLDEPPRALQQIKLQKAG